MNAGDEADFERCLARMLLRAPQLDRQLLEVCYWACRDLYEAGFERGHSQGSEGEHKCP